MGDTRDKELEAAFAREYLADPDMCAWKAAQRAGYKADKVESLKSQASRLLRRPRVKALIEIGMAERAARTEITADKVLDRLWAIATADPNDLVQHRRSACRYCHGINHRYQWIDDAEYEEAAKRAQDRKKPEPSFAGGYGFSTLAEPHPDCPRCQGEGTGRTFIADTRRLRGPARLLYAGMKETREGIEVKLQDQQAALLKVAQHLGMFTDRVELTGKDGGPVEIESKGGVSGLLAAARQASADADRG